MGEYIYVATMMVMVVVLVAALPLVSSLLGPRRPSERKLAPYECGITPEQDAAGPYSIKFSIVAMLFLLFDVELMFFYPWAAAYGRLGLAALFAMLFFVAVLAVGFLYEWRVGAFDWDLASRVGRSAGESMDQTEAGVSHERAA